MREASDVRRETEEEVKLATPPRVFTSDDEIRGLELAAKIGRNAATRQLNVSKSLFQKWTERHPKEWSDFRAGRSSEFGKEFAAQLEDLAENYTEAEEEAIRQALEQIKTGDLDAKELAALIKAMGSSRGVAATNARQARGEPDKTLDININFPQLEQAAEAVLARATAPPAIDVSSEELPDG
jgi:hypothetical protein